MERDDYPSVLVKLLYESFSPHSLENARRITAEYEGICELMRRQIESLHKHTEEMKKRATQ